MRIPLQKLLPFTSRPRNVTTSVAAAWIKRPPLTPAVAASQQIVTELLTNIAALTAYRPESTQLTSPPRPVTVKASAKLAHGAVRLQLLEALPVPDCRVPAT